MERRELDFVLKQNRFLKGGTKEACIKIRDFLRHAVKSENQIHSSDSCITADEFMEAVRTLMAFAYQQDDNIPERWRCDGDCRRVSYLFCSGECNTSDESQNLCPFFMDESLI